MRRPEQTAVRIPANADQQKLRGEDVWFDSDSHGPDRNRNLLPSVSDINLLEMHSVSDEDLDTCIPFVRSTHFEQITRRTIWRHQSRLEFGHFGAEVMLGGSPLPTGEGGPKGRVRGQKTVRPLMS